MNCYVVQLESNLIGYLAETDGFEPSMHVFARMLP